MVRQSVLSTSCFMFSNAVWCSAIQIWNAQSHSLVVRGVNTLVYSESAGKKAAMYLVNPKNPLTLVAVIGWGQAVIQLVLQGSGFIPAPDMMCLRKHSSVANRLDFASLQ